MKEVYVLRYSEREFDEYGNDYTSIALEELHETKESAKIGLMKKANSLNKGFVAAISEDGEHLTYIDADDLEVNNKIYTYDELNEVIDELLDNGDMPRYMDIDVDIKYIVNLEKGKGENND